MTEGDSKTKEISKQVYRQLALTGHTTQKLRKFIYHEVVYLNKRNYFSSAPQCSLFTNVVLRLVILWCWGKTLFGIILRTRGGIMLLKEDQSGSTVLRFRILFSSPSSFFNLLQPLCKRLPITNLARRLLIADEFYWSVMYVLKNWNLLLVGK